MYITAILRTELKNWVQMEFRSGVPTRSHACVFIDVISVTQGEKGLLGQGGLLVYSRQGKVHRVSLGEADFRSISLGFPH